jgi:hypothetical protein
MFCRPHNSAILRIARKMFFFHSPVLNVVCLGQESDMSVLVCLANPLRMKTVVTRHGSVGGAADCEVRSGTMALHTKRMRSTDAARLRSWTQAPPSWYTAVSCCYYGFLAKIAMLFGSSKSGATKPNDRLL